METIPYGTGGEGAGNPRPVGTGIGDHTIRGGFGAPPPPLLRRLLMVVPDIMLQSSLALPHGFHISGPLAYTLSLFV